KDVPRRAGRVIIAERFAFPIDPFLLTGGLGGQRLCRCRGCQQGRTPRRLFTSGRNSLCSVQRGSVQELVEALVVTRPIFLEGFYLENAEKVALLMQDVFVESGEIGGGQQESADAEAATRRPRDKAITNHNGDAELKDVFQVIDIRVDVHA